MKALRTVRFAVPSREVLEEIARAPIGVTPGEITRRYRDVVFDTPSERLARGGDSVSVRVREDGEGDAVRLSVELGDPAAAQVDPPRVSATARVPASQPREALFGDSDPARLIRHLVAPAELEPRMVLRTERRIRRLRGRDGEGAALLVLDAISVRADGNAHQLFEAAVRAPRGDRVAREAIRHLTRLPGLRRVRESRLDRARAALRGPAEAPVPLESPSVALLVLSGDEIGLLEVGNSLTVPLAPGQGENAARSALASLVGEQALSVRRLGTALPVGIGEEEMEVWIADDVERDASDGGLRWTPLSSVLAAAGTPALRDRRTLAALHMAARSEHPRRRELLRESGVESAFTAGTATVAAPGPGRRMEDDGSLPPGSLLNMELSTLAFNRRVLVLAQDARNPLLERVFFLSIFGANMDEFFRVRVAGFKRQIARGSTRPTIDGALPREQLDAIRIRARHLSERAYALLRDSLLPELGARGIEIVPADRLTAPERRRVRERFDADIHPRLQPQQFGPGHPFPHIRNLRPALAVVSRAPGDTEESFTVIELPGEVPRLLPLDERGRFIAIEEVIRLHLPALYGGHPVVRADLFRVTRSAEMRIPKVHPEKADLLMLVEEELEKRPYRPVVRLEVERGTRPELRRLLLGELQLEDREGVGGLREEDVYVVDGLMDLAALGEISRLPRADLHFPPLERRNPLDPSRPVPEQLREREVLVHFPFDSFEATVERFLLEAAEDPDVVSIQLALYRTDRDSRIVDALIRAAEKGKRVQALVELTARFDEQRNIEWAHYLRRGGIHVLYGTPGEKIHAKVALVTRREGRELRHYSYIGTGNLNAATASAYTDLGILTADRDVGADAEGLFAALVSGSPHPDYRTLLVAPVSMRRGFMERIEREADLARQGAAGHIRAKVNGLADREIIAALYRASNAGVRIELLVRGICSLRPGVPGLSENIRVLSILGRFLEHSRIFAFANAGDPEVLIGSADWRTRNLSRRVEAVIPIRDPEHRERLDRVLQRQLADPDAWELRPDGSYSRQTRPAPPEPIVPEES